MGQQRIGIVLEAVAFLRFDLTSLLPVPDGKELLEVVTKVSDRIPDIAKQFGIEPSRRKHENDALRTDDADKEKSPETEPALLQLRSAVETSVDAANQDLEPATVRKKRNVL